MKKVTLSFVSQDETFDIKMKREHALKIPFVKNALTSDGDQNHIEINFRSCELDMDHYHIWLKIGIISQPTRETIILADFLGDTKYVSLASKKVDWSQYKDIKNQHPICQKYMTEWYLDQCFHTAMHESDKIVVNRYYNLYDGIIPEKVTFGGKKPEFSSETCMMNFLTIDREIAQFIWENTDKNKLAIHVGISAKRRKGFVSSNTLEDLEKYLRRIKQLK